MDGTGSATTSNPEVGNAAATPTPPAASLRWDPLRAMALGIAQPATVRVTSATVPAGGMVNVVATGFGHTARLEVFLDHDWHHPIAAFDLDDETSVHDRVPIPVGTRTGPHSLTFVSEHAEYDLLVDVTQIPTEVWLDTTDAMPGGSVRFDVRGFPPGEVAHVKLDDGGTAFPFRVGVDGTGSGAFPLPPATVLGHHHLRFLAQDPPTSALEAFRVSAPGEMRRNR